MEKSWAEQWVTSDGYQKAMAARAELDGKFWERHHKVMSELDEQDRITDLMLDGFCCGVAWAAIGTLALGVIAAIF